MKTLVLLLACIFYAVAEPPLLFRHDIPHIHGYRYDLGPAVQPLPIVKEVLPVAHPLSYLTPLSYAGLKTQYYDRDLIGQAKYGHVEPGQLHQAVQDASGNKIGGFSYYNAEGKLVQTSYIADSAGFRVTSNDLPVDTPEVLAAKAAHFAEHDKIKFRSKRDAFLAAPASTTHFVAPHSHIDYRIAGPIPHAFPTTFTVPVVKPDGFLADTPEVAAAKSLHFAEWNAARARSFSPITPVPHFDYRFVSPYSYTPVVRPDGFLADTPEVAAAKSLHFAEVAKAKARVGYPYLF